MTNDSLPVHDWRCGNCGAEHALGSYTLLGGVSISTPRRIACPFGRTVKLDMHGGAVVVHCGDCHEWRQLAYDRETFTWHERPWRGPVPGDCRAVAV